jgi:hypothetical protein
LGTFLGVFTPSILTILGVVLFLRVGWVVGKRRPGAGAGDRGAGSRHHLQHRAVLGLQRVEAGGEDAYAERLTKLVGNLPTVILVSAAGPFAGQLLGTESAER